MWDLTVPGNNDHDFYIVAVTADTSVLVHNSGGIGDCPTSDSGPEQTVHGAERAADPSQLDPAAPADVDGQIPPRLSVRFSQRLSADHLVFELREDEDGFGDVADL